MPSTRNPDFDKTLGANIRCVRVARKMSQSALAERLGVSFQQVQKYETGKDRLSVQKLLVIAEVLGRPPAEFLVSDAEVIPIETGSLRQHLGTASKLDRLQPRVRRQIAALIDSLADQEPAGTDGASAHVSPDAPMERAAA